MARLAIVCVFAEERWASIELIQERLLRYLPREADADIQTIPVHPRFIRRFGRLPLAGAWRASLNGDRLMNRLVDYPRYLSARSKEFEAFHVSDHSYSQLVHCLPAERTGVFCNDLDMFRSLIEPQKDPRSFLFRMMARRILRGMQSAALVFYSTAAIRREIERHGLVDPSRLVYAPHGVSPIFCPKQNGEDPSDEEVKQKLPMPFVLHVGSCIPRKRIDVLLRVFHVLRSQHPEIHLVQFGGEWSAAQRALIAEMRLEPAVHQWSGRSEAFAAALYRQAALVLFPSEAEGFGLPVVEALACGNIVIASDISVLREVGGLGAVYCPVGDIQTWAQTADRLLEDPLQAPDGRIRLAQAGCFSLRAHADRILDSYRRLLNR